MIDDSDDCRPGTGRARQSRRGGPPWAQFGPRPGGRMFAQGDLRLLLLALIADRPSHGYELIRTIEDRFSGNYAPSPGAVYPTLTFLEEAGFIEPEEFGASKKSYRITDAGTRHLQENADAVATLLAHIEAMAGSGEVPPDSVLRAIATLRHAITGKPGGWSAAEAKRVSAVLEDAAKRIFGEAEPAAASGNSR